LIKQEGLYDDEVKDDKKDLEEKDKEEKKPSRKTEGAVSKEETIKIPKAQENKEDDEDDEFFQVEQEVEEESIFTLSKPK
jgi:hypothetical protein